MATWIQKYSNAIKQLDIGTSAAFHWPHHELAHNLRTEPWAKLLSRKEENGSSQDGAALAVGPIVSTDVYSLVSL